MTTAIDGLETRLVTNPPPVSFDFGFFAPFLIDAFIQVLSGCGGDGAARAKERLKNPTSARTRYAVRKAIRIASDESNIDVVGSNLVKTQDHFLSQCAQCSEEEIEALFNEVEETATETMVFL